MTAAGAAGKSRHQNIVACFLLLVKNEKVLLLKRKNTGYRDGQYSLVSGHVDFEESFSQAMIREAREEVGLDVKADDLRVIHVMHRKSRVDQSERVDVYFLAKSWRNDPVNKEPDKCAHLKWFDRQSLPEETVPYIRNVLRSFAQGQFYSEWGWKNQPAKSSHEF